jgi:hypothetical protein
MEMALIDTVTDPKSLALVVSAALGFIVRPISSGGDKTAIWHGFLRF